MIEDRVAKLSTAQRAALVEKLAALKAPKGEHAAGSHLVAHVVLREGKNESSEVLRSYLGAMLPPYMIPDIFNFLPSLPVTPNGKVDRRALSSLHLSRESDGDSFAEPRNELERELCMIFAEILGVRRVGVTDDFFDLGGHSLHVIRAVSKIRDLLDVSLRVPEFFELRTVEKLAINFHQEEPKCTAPPASQTRQNDTSTSSSSEGNDASIVIPIQEKGAYPPLFVIHSAMGAMVEAPRLSDLLGPEQPLYAVCAQWKHGRGPQSFEEMASVHVAEILKVSPEGPYALMGYCFGGNLAYEIGRQLVKSGRAVSFLGIIEAYPRALSTHPWWAPRSLFNVVRNMTYKAWTMRQRSPKEIAQVSKRLLWRLRSKLLHKSLSGPVPPEFEVGYIDMSGVPEEQVRLREERIELLLKYEERPCPIPITLFRSKGQSGFSTLGNDLGWGELAPVTVVIVGGQHQDLLEEPHIVALANALKKRLYN